MASADARHAVWLRGIEKQFPGVIACVGADLLVRPGTIHALLGENGAGKTTMVNVLAGVYRPDGGEVWVNGQRRFFQSPADAIAAGVGMVYQEFRLVPTLTVAENVVLGAAPRLLRNAEIEERVAELSAAYGMAADPNRPVWQLSMGERQRVEILKALWRNASVLVMDEPTAVLTPSEAAELGVTLRAMAEEGRSVIYISHKLDQVVAFCDEATVLRQGKTVATVDDLQDVDLTSLAEMMVGSTGGGYVQRPPELEPGPEVLTLQGVSALNDRGLPALTDIDMTVHANEIVGIVGVSGNGQKELAEVINGLRRPTQGQVSVKGQDVTDAAPGDRYRLGLAYVPEDRIGVGLAPKMSVVDNAVVRSYRSQRRGLMLVMDKCVKFCQDLVERFGVRAGRLHDPVAGLSGGNLQRLLLGRELAEQPAVLVAAQPTRGLDVQGVAAIQGHLADQRSDGVGILLISEDLDELLALSDRLLVMYEGRVVAEYGPDVTPRSVIGEAMAGQVRTS
ncbi:ABC transporter ATP-binding protein [Candidatus Poriferisocius sp.]|uniref:ABC transporter ATP-binding protein n=1 Tax=Candidatus Poriferisocius sp. TaxID=3101276 RepID=UPI003B02BB86